MTKDLSTIDEKVIQDTSLKSKIIISATSIAISAGIVLGVNSLSGCSSDAFKDYTEQKPVYTYIKLGVSDVESTSNKAGIRYCGMIGDVFDVAAKTSELSSNIHYSKNSKNINFYGRNLEVLKITSDSLILRECNR